jgi:hypothetical protein
MKKLSIILLLLTGCVNLKISTVTFDPETKQVSTNDFKGTFFFSKTTAEKIDVATRTKTTSKLLEAKSIQNTGDAEMIKAIADALGNAFAAGAKAAVKP